MPVDTFTDFTVAIGVRLESALGNFTQSCSTTLRSEMWTCNPPSAPPA